ncbi:hypothetical protein MCAP1_002906 [Malassezia caprae]|uniref:F-box domain-containing protein n=1 Tax=Malassezia caprae TaxID=1381934 RepID=A0AAF0EDP1_9BASI|nr:hypothetical protein MCAP1_002906 [Malassezia caprae]
MARHVPAVHRVPLELWAVIFTYMEPKEIVCVRKTMRAMFMAGVSAALWHQLYMRHAQQCPLAAYKTSQGMSVDAMERALLVRDQMNRAWAKRGAHPVRVIRFRAHVNRITSVRLVVGPPQPRQGGIHASYWLLTGSVDGYVRVWDVNRVLQQNGSLNVTPELAVDALARSTCDESTCDEDEPRVLPTDPAHDIKRSARAFLVAEVDTGGDVTSIDAQVDPEMRIVTIAVGSYYSTAGALLYELRLRSLPHMLDICASLDPPEWGGTQCVSLLDDVVAIGTYTGRVYLLHWRSGERIMLEQLERGSIAALALLDTHVVAVSRMGHITIYERRGTVEATLVGQHTVGQHPLISASLGTVDERRMGMYRRPGAVRELPLLSVDPTGMTHWSLNFTRPTEPPRCVAHHEMSERMIGASVGATGHHGILTSSLGGVPPICAVRLYTQGTPLVPIRPTPDIALPADSHSVPVLGPLPAGAPPPSSPTPPRRVRVDSFSSTSTTSSTAPSPSSRVDMLSESAMDEARGVVCLASVRGAVWIADYGGNIDTM